MKTVKNAKRILGVKIKHMVDDSPDTSWLGEYSSSATSVFSIDRKHSEDCPVNDRLTAEAERILQRAIDAIESERTVCEDHTDYHNVACPVCAEEKSEQTAIDELTAIMDSECTCGERGDMQRNEYRYFNPSFNYVNKAGEALPENSPAEVKKYVRQDYERMERMNRGDWYSMGISAEAEISIPTQPGNGILQRVSSGGLWGIESDSDRAYIVSVEAEQFTELKQQLTALGFSGRAIATALKDVKSNQ
jgi:hypothetical protein